MNIHQRIDAVRRALGDGYLQKDTHVSGAGGGYNALTYDKLIRYVRPHLLKHGIVLYPRLVSSSRADGQTKNGGFVLRYSAVYDVEFVNMDDPADMYVCRVEADANDSGDKATAKALTVALRIALRSVLSIETGEDEEQRGEEMHAQKYAPDGTPIPPVESMREWSRQFEAMLLENNIDAAYEAWGELTQGEVCAVREMAPNKANYFSREVWNMLKSGGAFQEYRTQRNKEESQ